MFESAIAATLGTSSHFGLRPCRSYCVILVDGLGFENLLFRKGHARFLSEAALSQRTINAAFPTTTAANIMSFATGLTVAEHGFVGHQVLDRESGVRINLLTGWGDQDPRQWQPKTTLSEKSFAKGLRVNVIGPDEYRESGFTTATMREVSYHPANSIEERFEVALNILSSTTPSVSYLYMPELDKQAHRTGWLSSEWSRWLELLDQQMGKLTQRLPVGVGLVLTSDHGVIDSPPEMKHYVDAIDSIEELDWFAGDSRASYLYLQTDANPTDVKRRLSEKFRGIAKVAASSELVAANYFVGMPSSYSQRIPELVLLAEGRHTLFHSSMSKPKSIEMVAHHGGLTPMELRIPLLTWSK